MQGASTLCAVGSGCGVGSDPRWLQYTRPPATTTTINTERSLFEQEDRLAESEGLVTENLIRIYRALGGGWSLATN